MSIDILRIRELAKTLKTWTQVLITAIREADMTQEEVCLLMKYDSGNFSRILSGNANFPPDRLREFNEILGHHLTLYWLCYQDGHEAHVLPKLLEKKIDEKNEELKEKDARISSLEKEIEIFKEVFASMGRNMKKEGE
jgi:transcriptional regulator with XRE-family HTH domain